MNKVFFRNKYFFEFLKFCVRKNIRFHIPDLINALCTSERGMFPHLYCDLLDNRRINYKQIGYVFNLSKEWKMYISEMLFNDLNEFLKFKKLNVMDDYNIFLEKIFQSTLYSYVHLITRTFYLEEHIEDFLDFLDNKDFLYFVEDKKKRNLILTYSSSNGFNIV